MNKSKRHEKPLLLINTKLYPQILGAKLNVFLKKIKHAKINITNWNIGVAPPQTMLGAACALTNLPVYAQHVDVYETGSHTGFVSCEELNILGCKGSILDHSEHPMQLSKIAKTVSQLQTLSLQSIVCVPSLAFARKVAALHPTYIAYEPPELIGGNISVTTAKPALITAVVAAVTSISPRTRVLVGAGVKTHSDVQTALSLGAQGVLVASGIVTQRDPGKALKSLLIQKSD